MEETNNLSSLTKLYAVNTIKCAILAMWLQFFKNDDILKLFAPLKDTNNEDLTSISEWLVCFKDLNTDSAKKDVAEWAEKCRVESNKENIACTTCDNFYAEQFAAETLAAEQFAAETLAAETLVAETLAAETLAAARVYKESIDAAASVSAESIDAAEKRDAESIDAAVSFYEESRDAALSFYEESKDAALSVYNESIDAAEKRATESIDATEKLATESKDAVAKRANHNTHLLTCASHIAYFNESAANSAAECVKKDDKSVDCEYLSYAQSTDTDFAFLASCVAQEANHTKSAKLALLNLILAYTYIKS